MANLINDDELEKYANSIEGNGNNKPTEDSIKNPKELLAEQAKAKIKENQENTVFQEKADIQEKIRQSSIDNGTALAPLPVEDLPSKGLFYPENTKIWIKAASLADIKRWTMLDETDPQDINEKIQNILQSCCKISYGHESGIIANWKDIIDIDRLYILFAIHDYSFPAGTNDIMIKLDESRNVKLAKDNVAFVDFSDKLMKFYDATKRCFVFPVRKTDAFKKTNGKMEIYMPKIGVANWIMDYIKACEQRKENYDRDLVVYANLLIPDWRNLNYERYADFVDSTREWSTYEWTLISKIKTIIADAAMTPKLKYKDEGGVEKETELNFRNGIKSIFEQKLDIDI